MYVSRDSVRRSLGQWATEAVPRESIDAPRVVGIDDWAFRKGQRYGIIICDLERHRVIDLLADRSSQSAAQWFREHPTIKIISRDRGGIYAQAARQGVPHAMQIADRWPLLKNLGEMLQRVVDREHKHLRQAAKDQTQKNVTDSESEADAECALSRFYCDFPVPLVTTPPVACGPPRAQQKSRLQRERRKAKYEAVVQLHQQGVGKRAIARALGLSRMTVRRYCQASEFPEMASRGTAGREHPKQLDAYREYLNERWGKGYRSGIVLWNEIRGQGFTGSLTAVYRLLRIWRAEDTTTPKRFVTRTKLRCVSIPSPRQMSWWLLYPEKVPCVDTRQSSAPVLEAAALAEAFQEKSSPVRAVTTRSREFIEMVANRRVDRLDSWLEDAASENVPELTHFVKSLRQDYEAVRGALNYEWSNGQVEGQVNRLKMIKRQMYGRAGFELLRQRVLAAR